MAAYRKLGINKMLVVYVCEIKTRKCITLHCSGHINALLPIWRIIYAIFSMFMGQAHPNRARKVTDLMSSDQNSYLFFFVKLKFLSRDWTHCFQTINRFFLNDIGQFILRKSRGDPLKKLRFGTFYEPQMLFDVHEKAD